MSSLTVFGDNLRYMCQIKNLAFAQACRDLDIGKVQFQRFLRGESFPKPNLLIKMCDYFNTDARILTTPLPFTSSLKDTDHNQQHHPMFRALQYATAGADYMPANCDLGDGNYQVWRQSFSYPNKIIQMIYTIKTINGARMIKAFEPMDAHHGSTAKHLNVASRVPRSREWRGYVHTIPEGHSLVFYGIAAPRWVKYMFISPHPTTYDNVFTGIMCFSRKEYVGLQRLSRVCWIKLPPNFSDLMKAARMPVWVDLEETPRVVRDTLSVPLG